MNITKVPFGTYQDKPVTKYILTNDHGVQAGILDFAGLLQSFKVPTKNGGKADMILTSENLDEFTNNGFCTNRLIGRVAGRIADGHFEINGKEYQLEQNEGKNTLGSGEVVGECTTSIEGSRSNRKTNVRVALSRFNGLRVDPGETVSFNAVALERTEANGYKEAVEYSEGESTTGIGGGTCQASTTMYGALLEAGVTIVERHNHSMTVGYVDPSLDAAVTDTGSKDLVFRNDSDVPLYIYTTVTDTSATVRIYGEKPPYRYVFRSIVIEDDIQPTSERVEVDTSGEYATYTDEKVLVTEGKTGMRSQLWRDSFDWETGAFIETVQISSDYYTPGRNIYYVGVQPRYAPTPSNPTTGNW